MLTSLKIFSEAEIHSRYEICLENYCKTVNIEGLTMVDMARKEILPAVEAYAGELSGYGWPPRRRLSPALACKYEKDSSPSFPPWRTRLTSAAQALDSTLVRLKTVSGRHRRRLRHPGRGSPEDGGAAGGLRRGRKPLPPPSTGPSPPTAICCSAFAETN